MGTQLPRRKGAQQSPTFRTTLLWHGRCAPEIALLYYCMSLRPSCLLSIVDLQPEDSGNYSCEIRGRRSSVLASVVHLVSVRGNSVLLPVLHASHMPGPTFRRTYVGILFSDSLQPNSITLSRSQTCSQLEFGLSHTI